MTYFVLLLGLKVSNTLCSEFCRVIEIKATSWQNCQPRTRRLGVFSQPSLHSSCNRRKYFCHRRLGSFLAPGSQFTHASTTHTHAQSLLLVPPVMIDETTLATSTPCGKGFGTHGPERFFFVSHTTRLLLLLMNDQYDHCPPFKQTGN